ncbi:MAG: peptide chain release factor N(5)-glutamine methyltransferase [Limisphaerales bacterium]
MRLLEVIQRGTTFLESRGVESPRLQVELILAHALRIPRLHLYLQFDRPLPTETLDAAREAIQRRGQRIPLQHILGSTSFCGLDLEVSPDVLIPRPETEGLAEHAWTWLNRRAPGPADPATSTPAQVLDWGTGSGCLAIAIAHHHPNARITALDVSPASLAVARRNAARHEVANRIEFLLSDGTESLPANCRFHLVVGNPPYIPTAEIETLEPEVRDHDPRLALDGGPDGLDFYRGLAANLGHRLLPGGAIMLEFGDGQASDIARLLSAAGWPAPEIHRDATGRERFLVAESPGPAVPSRNS